MSERVMVLLNAYKYIKRCSHLIYFVNCIERTHITSHYMWRHKRRLSDVLGPKRALKVCLSVNREVISILFSL